MSQSLEIRRPPQFKLNICFMHSLSIVMISIMNIASSFASFICFSFGGTRCGCCQRQARQHFGKSLKIVGGFVEQALSLMLASVNFLHREAHTLHQTVISHLRINSRRCLNPFVTAVAFIERLYKGS